MGSAEVGLIRRLLQEHPDWHRTRLSQELCAIWNRRNDAGQLKDMAARTLLLKLEQREMIILPPLHWDEPPAGTLGFVMIMDDPDAVSVIGIPFDHWVLYDIPANIRALPAGIPATQTIPQGGTHGLTTRDAYGYMGPCPPPGRGEHQYIFTLYALDIVLNQPPGMTKDMLLQQIEGHVLAKAQRTGLYSRCEPSD